MTYRFYAEVQILTRSFLFFLQNLLSRAVAKTEGAEVDQLEKLYALLAQCIYRHRNNYNKTMLIKVK